MADRSVHFQAVWMERTALFMPGYTNILERTHYGPMRETPEEAKRDIAADCMSGTEYVRKVEVE